MLYPKPPVRLGEKQVLMRIIAKLDVKPPNVVKPVHFDGLRKMGSPTSLAQKFYTQGADEIFYIDIVASLYQREVLFDQVAEAARGVFVPFAVGGGVRTLDDMTRLFHCGADKIVLNTYPLQEDPTLIDQAAHLFGSQSVVVHIDAKQWGSHWECYSDCGRERSGKDVLEWAREVQERGAGEILLQSIDADGRQRGFDIELASAVKEHMRVPLVVGSGAGSIPDIQEVAEKVHPDAIAVSSVLHYETCTINEIKAALLLPLEKQEPCLL